MSKSDTKLLELELNALRQQVEFLAKENDDLRMKLRINPEEELILREIKYLDDMSQRMPLDLNETKRAKMLFESLVSMRRMSRGLSDDVKKPTVKKEDISSLLKLVKKDE